MMGLAKVAPYLLIAAMAGAGYHVFTVWQKDREIAQLMLDQTTMVQESQALREASDIQKNTIEQLARASRERQERANQLTAEKNALAQDRDSYVSIFRRHDLTRLALAKPGLIEPRINDGTRKVLEGLERLTEIPQ
jgi:uncharacterized protein HemX